MYTTIFRLTQFAFLTGSDPETYSISMPAKNSLKFYIENGYYHIYNRGVEKRDIFLDENDYRMFLYQLKYYLGIPKEDDIKQKKRSIRSEIVLLGYCLMPNHFHLFIKQLTKTGMTKLLRAICTNYVCYFNKRYKRVGTLFQGKYKAALIENEPNLLHVSRYIHINPLELDRVGPWKGSDPLGQYPYSSYSFYLGLKAADWLNSNEILGYFKSAQKIHLRDILSYQSFVEDYPVDSKDYIKNLALE